MFLCLLLALGCKQAVPVQEFFPGDQVLEKWEDVFIGRTLDLQIPEPELLHVNRVAIGSRGQLYIPRGGSARTVLELDRDGRLMNEIQVGVGGAYSIFTVDPEDNLVLFAPDGDGGWVTVLSGQDGRVLRRFRISSWPAALLALRDGTIVTYSAVWAPGSSEKVFELFNQNGRRVEAAHRVQDDTLRIFHGRVQTGGIVQLSNGGDLIGLHPAAFELVRLSPNLEVLELLRAPRNDPWAPHPPGFPPGLDPYDYRPPHEEWWDSFLHIGSPFALTSDILVVSLWVSRGMADTKNLANIYRVTGELLARGLIVPHDGRIIGAAGGVVYVVRNASLSDGGDGSAEPLELYEYTLRDHVSALWNPDSD